MKPKGFEVTTVVTERTRYVSEDPQKPSGWWVELLLDSSTKLRLFFPDELFAVKRQIGVSRDEMKKPIEQTVIMEPDLLIGEPVILAVQIPLVDAQ